MAIADLGRRDPGASAPGSSINKEQCVPSHQFSPAAERIGGNDLVTAVRAQLESALADVEGARRVYERDGGTNIVALRSRLTSIARIAEQRIAGLCAGRFVPSAGRSATVSPLITRFTADPTWTPAHVGAGGQTNGRMNDENAYRPGAPKWEDDRSAG